MATVTATVKIKNKNRDEHPLWVIFRHQKIEVAVSTGENVNPKHFKKGKVIGDQGIALNELVSTIGAELYKAYEIVYKRGEELTNQLIKEEYERIRDERLTKDKWDKFLHQGEVYGKSRHIYSNEKTIRRLSQEIEERTAAIAIHQQRLAELTGNIPQAEDERQHYFTTYVEKYMTDKVNMQRNTKGTYEVVRLDWTV